MEELARKIVAKADAFSLASGLLIGRRQRYEDLLEGAQTKDVYKRQWLPWPPSPVRPMPSTKTGMACTPISKTFVPGSRRPSRRAGLSLIHIYGAETITELRITRRPTAGDLRGVKISELTFDDIITVASRCLLYTSRCV